MECQVSPMRHQKEGKIQTKATVLKIYTVLYFTHKPETIDYQVVEANKTVSE